MDFETLYSECSMEAFTSAKKRFYDDKVSDLNLSRADGKTVVTAAVSGHRIYRTDIIFDEQGGLYDYHCTCDKFSMSDGPCKHIIATALTFEDRNPTLSHTNPTQVRRSDAVIPSLITLYTRRKHTLDASKGRVEIVPILEVEDSGIYLHFYIGLQKKYKLRNIADFATAMSNGSFRKYGVELSLVHSPLSFEAGSRDLAKFICDAYRETEGLGYIDKSRMKLLPSSLDTFLEIMDGKLVETAEYGMGEGMCLVTSQLDQLKLTITTTGVDNGYELALSMRDIKLLSGARYRYLITPGRIYRVSDDYISVTYDAIKAFNNNGKIYVADKDMPLLYNNVLCKLSSYINFEGEDLTSFAAPPLTAKLDLELSGNIIEAVLTCSYADRRVDIMKEEDTGNMMRDWESENTLREVLTEYFPYAPRLAIDDEQHIFRLLNEGLGQLCRYCDIFMSEEMLKVRLHKTPKVNVGVRLGSNLLDIDLSAEDMNDSDVIKLLEAYKAGRNFVRIGDGSFVAIDGAALKNLSEILDLGKRNEQGKLTMPLQYAPMLTRLRDENFDIIADTATNALGDRLKDNDKYALPQSLEPIMRNYQKVGYRWLRTLAELGYGGILADDMGLGKSLQVIALLMSVPHGTSIVVCPTSLILNWQGEIAKFAPQMRAICIMGSGEERAALIRTIADYDIVITSYELLRRDYEHYVGFTFEYAIIDEAQYIKNHETKNSYAVKMLSSRHRFALTGTPIENSLSELWSIFDFIMPGYLFDYNKFRREYETEIVCGNREIIAKMERMVDPFILRRLKSAVLTELPPKIESDIVSPLTGQQRTMYLAQLAEAKQSIGSQTSHIALLSMLTKLRLICCDPQLVDPTYSGNSTKKETCLDLIETAASGGHKIIVFSQFTSMLDILRRELSSRGISHYVLKGDTPKAERMKFIGRFNRDQTNVFLISLRAGGTGLNLTGADVVIHYDPWWNESVMNQATDRAYRIGQNKSVQVYKLSIENTLERKIVELQKKKSALSGIIVESDNNLTFENIMEILS